MCRPPMMSLARLHPHQGGRQSSRKTSQVVVSQVQPRRGNMAASRDSSAEKLWILFLRTGGNQLDTHVWWGNCLPPGRTFTPPSKTTPTHSQHLATFLPSRFATTGRQYLTSVLSFGETTLKDFGPAGGTLHHGRGGGGGEKGKEKKEEGRERTTEGVNEVKD